MALLSVQNISHAFGGPRLLDEVAFQIEKGDRVCLFGRNGEGKSTLLKILAKELKPDSGTVDLSSGATMATLEQAVPGAHAATVFDVVTSSMGKVSEVLSRYDDAMEAVTASPTESNLDRLAKAQHAMDAIDAWGLQQRVSNILSRLELDPHAEFASLSGGWRRRAYLARALAMEPEVLLLDEPTNHLDIAAIRWLENYLIAFKGAVVFVTHDRMFLENIASRIFEIDRGKVVEYPVPFDKYLEAKEAMLDVEAKHNADFDKKLAKEEEWIRTGIKARRTRNEGRVRALKRLRTERTKRRNRKNNVRLRVQETRRTGEIVFEAHDLSFGYEENSKIIDDLNVRIMREERIGLIGPNGVGKTTLLNLLLGKLQPTSGTIHHGTKLEVAYYDQLRSNLDLEKTLVETLSPESDHVVLGEDTMHVLSYLRNFLFDADQARAPVRILSGGERNRLLLAKLFLLPSNVLVLDEPTNDLDMETLAVLEDFLTHYSGTVLLVSHDRAFLDNIASRSFVFQENERIELIEGGYSEALKILEREAEKAVESSEMMEEQKKKEVKTNTNLPKKKLSYNEQRELDSLPEMIEKMEARQTEIQESLSSPEVYSNADKVKILTEELENLDDTLMAAFERWDALGA